MKVIVANPSRAAFVRAPHCEGVHCSDPGGEVRVYPLLFAARVILCRRCWGQENRYRQQRGKELHCPEHWPTRDWDAAERYQPSRPSVETTAIATIDRFGEAKASRSGNAGDGVGRIAAA
jgi:hypothetical protein